jgi:DNA-binding IclR family transcriptional regulator
MSSPARVFAVLDLFSRQRPVWQPDEINEALGYTRATGYRYVKELVEAGFLQKVSAGRYALGARIIELDYQLRQSDPILLAAIPVMDALAADSDFDAVLTVLLNGPKVIDIHRASVQKSLHLTYGRGRPRPLFRSGAPKILLSFLPRAPLVKIHAAYAAEIEREGMGASWSEFRAYCTQVRKEGFYLSLGELEPAVGAAVVPVLNAEDEAVAALALVGTIERLNSRAPEALRATLTEASSAIRTGLMRG